ncbi:hypothetical protein [Streptomyces fagopyri]|uniref:hypothetical protein n=1 Tax=Streptomyces fagopyri TaxID=2662397 RepID=UPI0033D8B604
MSSEIIVDDECMTAFEGLKGEREVNTVIYRLIGDLDTCVVESQENLTHDDLLLTLPTDDPRLVLHELDFSAADGARHREIVLISWLPPRAAPESRAAYASAHAALLDILDGIQWFVRAGDLAELDYHRLVAQARAKGQ